MAPGDEDWIPICTGTGAELTLVKDELDRLGIPSVLEEELLVGAVGVTGSPETSYYSLAIPGDARKQRRREIDELVATFERSREGDAAAMAEAEQDYDVRGCPNCGRYFRERLWGGAGPDRCPGCGASLLPAVDCLGEGQLAPDRVIVGYGSDPDMQGLAARLREGAFGAEVVEPRGWRVSTVEIPWSELTDRSEELEERL